jgi:hypothetical protein
MNIENIDPTTFNWDNINTEKANGELGYAIIKTQEFDIIKIRQVEYSKNYLADHWCDKGHILFVTSGQLIIEHRNNTEVTLNSGSAYVVGDNTMAHKAKSVNGALVLIID